MLVERRNLIWERGTSKEAFAASINETGGWPVGCSSVSFRHGFSDQWWCMFTGGFLDDDWWTVIMTADEYHWLSMSAEAKAEIRRSAKLEFITEISRLAPCL